MRVLDYLQILVMSDVETSGPLSCNPGSDFLRASLVAQSVKNLPVMQETWVRSLVGEDPPEKGMRTHSSILAWGIPWTEEPDGLQSMGVAKSGTPLSAFHFTYFNLIYLASVGLACGPWRLQSLLWHWSSCGELLWHGTLVGNSCGIGTLVGNSCGIGPLVAACGVFIHCVWYLVP